MPRPLLILVLATASLLAPATASAAQLYTPNDATAPDRPFARPLQDTIVGTPAGVARTSGARAKASQSAQTFFSSDGTASIKVALSGEYGPVTKEKVQGTGDFLASRLHGTELRRLTALILTPSELQDACNATEENPALACYVPARELMIIPGQQTPRGQVPVEYVITHEYGHHVAANRNNDPFNDPSFDSAVAFGPKRWATYEQVCAGVLSRPQRSFPRGEEANGSRSPVETWAEAYGPAYRQA